MIAALLLQGSAMVFTAPVCEQQTLPPRPDISALAQDRRERFWPLVRSAACRHGVEPLLLDALVVQESRYNPAARSHAGAIGLGQLMPGTARYLGVDPYNPAQNVDGAARYLKEQLDEFGSVRLALAAYNAGPGRVRERMAVPRISETITYVATIERDLARWGRAGSSPNEPYPSPATLLSTSYDPAAIVPEGGEGEEAAVRPAPPEWDVFARFRWEQEQVQLSGEDDEDNQ